MGRSPSASWSCVERRPARRAAGARGAPHGGRARRAEWIAVFVETAALPPPPRGGARARRARAAARRAARRRGGDDPGRARRRRAASATRASATSTEIVLGKPLRSWLARACARARPIDERDPPERRHRRARDHRGARPTPRPRRARRAPPRAGRAGCGYLRRARAVVAAAGGSPRGSCSCAVALADPAMVFLAGVLLDRGARRPRAVDRRVVRWACSSTTSSSSSRVYTLHRHQAAGRALAGRVPARRAC